MRAGGMLGGQFNCCGSQWHADVTRDTTMRPCLRAPASCGQVQRGGLQGLLALLDTFADPIGGGCRR